jgi:hypothetical protein
MLDESWSALAGAVSCALYNVGDAPEGAFDRETLTQVIRRLPFPILAEAFRHGFDNDLVGINVVNHLQAQFEEPGSLATFLQGSAVLS